MAIVDYGVRVQSKEEVAYAQTLAKKYNKKLYIKNASKIESNFEANARKIRYEFFEEIISEQDYETLLTAHHLGDKLEWFLMQFCKGSGCVELVGMQGVEKRSGYEVVRPLLGFDKSELLAYLHSNNIEYFEDESNQDERYKRNYFRHNFSNPLLQEYKEGIKKSFEYMQKDREELVEEAEVVVYEELVVIEQTSSLRSNIYNIDKQLKSFDYMLSKSERELLAQKSVLVVGRKYVVVSNDMYIFIAPFKKTINFTKEFKERCRKLKIEPKLRGYLFENPQVLVSIAKLF
jgi:tRNA(Ile)-lysidine synthase